MITINKQVDYALQFILALAQLQDGERLSIRRFSDKKKLSFLFLQKIVSLLKKAELVNSTQGANGGYTLAKAPEEVSLADIVSAVEKKGMVHEQLDCVGCEALPFCTSKTILTKVHTEMQQILNTYTVKTMMV